ncbi:conserved hypothetical protein [Methylocella tundrae]|nr:conserved hypothetical protein [Methylocella tundrae]
MLTGDRTKNELLNDAFPLFQGGEYDFCFPKAFWKIGMQSSIPNSLKKKIAASIISEQFGLKSVDNVSRKYLKGVNYPESDNERLDRRVRSFVAKKMSAFNSQIYVLSKRTDQGLNRTMSQWTLGRASFSMELLAYCGQRGALFEALAIARMMLEQVAWAHSVCHSNDEGAVHRVSASASISFLKGSSKNTGKLYGWLSQHVHWAFDGHKKSVITTTNDALGHLYASAYFKAVVFCVMIILVDIYFQCSWKLYAELEDLKAEKGAQTTTPAQVKSEAIQLLNEIVACEPQDEELRYLCSILDDQPR